MKKYLFFLALAGWIMATVAHILSLVRMDVAEIFPYIWLLHIGIFVVFVPMVFDMQKNEELKEYKNSILGKKINVIEMYKVIFKYTPKWMFVLVAICFCYGIINFILFFFEQHGTASIHNGIYVLENRGQFIRNITEKEYHYYIAQNVRGFSGHWMVFYSFATAYLYKFINIKSKK